jgi:hypothetical protein
MFLVERASETRRDFVERSVEFGLREPAAFEHHARASLGVRDTGERVGFEQD